MSTNVYSHRKQKFAFSSRHPRFWSIRTGIIWKFGILDIQESMRHHPSWLSMWNPTPLNAYGTVPWMVMAMVRGGQYCLILPYILINVSSSLAFSRGLDCVIWGNSQFKGSVAGSPCLLREKISFEKWLSQERSNQSLYTGYPSSYFNTLLAFVIFVLPVSLSRINVQPKDQIHLSWDIHTIVFSIAFCIRYKLLLLFHGNHNVQPPKKYELWEQDKSPYVEKQPPFSDCKIKEDTVLNEKRGLHNLWEHRIILTKYEAVHRTVVFFKLFLTSYATNFDESPSNVYFKYQFCWQFIHIVYKKTKSPFSRIEE